MIDKLENGYAVGDPILRGIVAKLNEVIDVVNSLPKVGFSSEEAEAAALDEALDPHA